MFRLWDSLGWKLILSKKTWISIKSSFEIRTIKCIIYARIYKINRHARGREHDKTTERAQNRADRTETQNQYKPNEAELKPNRNQQARPPDRRNGLSGEPELNTNFEIQTMNRMNSQKAEQEA